MAKGKAYKTKPDNMMRQSANAKSIIKRRHHSQQKALQYGSSRAKPKRTAQQRPLKVLFGRHDNVLLLGEGDFSFALSLMENYRPASLVATCYDGKEQLVQKYPNVKDTIENLVGGSSHPTGPEDPSRSNSHSQPDEQEAWEGLSPSPMRQLSPSKSDGGAAEARVSSQCRVLYGIDATKLSTTHRKRLRALGPFSRIAFNFPHVGGLSTDVNRQVRANQQLLVGFFNATKPHLSSPQYPVRSAKANRYNDELSDEDVSTKVGQILVTIFEGEPYTLWNIRDLARHCGLEVIESFKFPWHAYPGYQHARTAGDITSGKDRADEGKKKGAWRGEERDARCYVLQMRGNGDSQAVGNTARKRHRLDESSDNDNH